MSTSFDLLIVTDATASMGNYLDALRTSIPEILALARLSGAFSRLGVLAYRDYSDGEVVTWSGWNTPDLQDFVRNLEPRGGGDFPEAAKTALIRALQAVEKSSQTLILWYADAPPHHVSVQSSGNDIMEAKAYPKGATDWVKLCRMAKSRNCTVFSFTPSSMIHEHSCFYILLSELTGGISISSNVRSSVLISRLTLDVILQWMGQTSDMESVLRDSAASLSQYKISPLQANLKLSDEVSGSQGYLPPSYRTKSVKPRLIEIHTLRLKPSHIPLGSLASQPFNLAKRFANPAETVYHDLVYASLAAIIESNVSSLTYNPIFGQLWRAVCKDTDKNKVQLLNAFSNRIGKVTDPTEKASLQRWLEDSFDATEEIENIIARVGTKGPMVYLDLDSDVELTRMELLEVSRSCYSGVLKRLASVFTHLKLVESDIKLAPNQRSIPLSLPPCDFFRILPHLVVPGTLYPPRAASLTAVLSLVTAVPFLREPAAALLTPIKGTWIDLDVPENISFDCARFLLSAPEGLVLTPKENRIYEAMRRYKLIELNLDSTLEVQVPWTPRKTRGVGDRMIKCKKCFIRRSVTIMSEDHPNVCGLCISTPEAAQNFKKEDEMDSCWVECSSKNCRAQYVVVNAAALKIRPRCYYCRNSSPCPSLECTRCANCIIVPNLYRSPEDRRHYTCPACDNNSTTTTTIMSRETTTRALNNENGMAWLGFSISNDIFEGKSAFKLMQAHGAVIFGNQPTSSIPPNLTLGGKKIHDPAQAVLQVEHRVGRGEVELGSCTLCFEEMSRKKLVPACGRTGCSQKVDDDCLREWYGKNEPGKLLNPMQLACPFCRRKPVIKVLTKYNPQAAAICGLQDAMDDRRWFYAWCLGCGFAKQAYERVCCQGDRIPAVEDFRCVECNRPAIPQAASIRLEKLTPCPKCGVLIEKIAGCNHMECQCGQHFCFVCGEGAPLSRIYAHIQARHGGAFDID